MKTAFVEVLLCNVMSAIKGAARYGGVHAVQHDVVLYIGALLHPVAASFGMRTFDHQVVEHGGNDLGDRVGVCVHGAACRTLLRRIGSGLLLLCLLGFPRMQAVPTEDVVALELDRVGKGTVADEADLRLGEKISR